MQKFILGGTLIVSALTFYLLVDIISFSRHETTTVEVLRSPEQITPPIPQKLSVAEKKERFIHTILPAVRAVKKALDADYARAEQLANSSNRTPEEEMWLQGKMRQFRVNGLPCLLRRMHTHPVSLVIAQAALETGWGRSRFFKEANNAFGIWSYNPDEPRIAASQQREDQTIFVKKFASLNDAIHGYFRMIGTASAYSGFRQARMQTDNPFELLRHLRRYSELRDEYVARIYHVINANRLYTLDDQEYPPIGLAGILPEYVAQKKEEETQQMLALNEVKVEPASEEDESIPCGEEENATRPAPALSTAAPGHSSLP